MKKRITKNERFWEYYLVEVMQALCQLILIAAIVIPLWLKFG